MKIKPGSIFCPGIRQADAHLTVGGKCDKFRCIKTLYKMICLHYRG